MFSRRGFLSGCLLSLMGSRIHASQELSLRGRVVRPRDLDYPQFCRWYNPAVHFSPEAIAMVECVEDIAVCLEWAKKQGIPVAVRCGGHSYVGLSGGDQLIIDVSKLQDFSLDESGLRVGAGWRLGPLRTRLANQGLMLPLGICPGVGLSGFLLGGGYGPAARHLGLGCDSVADVSLVSPSLGQLSARTAEELMWGLKGSGFGQFGVVDSWLLKPVATQSMVVFRRRWPWNQAARIVEFWQQWAPHADTRITSYLSLRADAGQRLTVGGMFLGSLPEWKSLDCSPPGLSEGGDKECTYLEAMDLLGGREQQDGPAFRATSDFLTAPLSRDAIRDLLDRVAEAARCSLRVTLDAYGGAIEDGSGAFVHRRGRLACVQALAYYGQHPSAPDPTPYLQRYSQTMRPRYSGEAYQNYCELGRTKQAYFGDDWSRLVTLKQKYDADNVLQHPLSFASKPTKG